MARPGASSTKPSPIWPRLLGAAALMLLGAAAIYAVIMGLMNFGRIGV